MQDNEQNQQQPEHYNSAIVKYCPACASEMEIITIELGIEMWSCTDQTCGVMVPAQ